MPRDEWARANAKSRAGRRPLPLREVFVVAPGTACRVRRVGERRWREYRTKKSFRVEGAMWRTKKFLALHYEGWEVLVPRKKVYVHEK